MKTVIEMAREAGWDDHHAEFDTRLKRFAELVRADERKKWEDQTAVEINEAVLDEREACAKAAESLWQQFQDTKDAHERLSPEPFMPSRFGFDQSTIQQSRRIADAIRARGETK